MESIWSTGFLSLPPRPCLCNLKHQTPSSSIFQLRTSRRHFYWNLRRIKLAPTKAILNDKDPKTTLSLRDSVAKFHESLSSLPSISFTIKRNAGSVFLLGICIASTTLAIIAVVLYTKQKSKYSQSGSVADLVRRGQLRSDRRGISRPLKYEDPFNNPLVKVGKSNSTVEMCGKVYRLAPVILTEEQRAIHQKRRSQAYQWKRPKVFLKEGDSVPPDVDPDTIRWIPSNHPFATTDSEIDEDLAQNNVYQKHGVPFRIQAEHEALQRKLEALQSEQKLDKLVIDSINAKNFQRPLHPGANSHKPPDVSPSDDQTENSFPAKTNDSLDSSDANSLTEETQRKPPV